MSRESAYPNIENKNPRSKNKYRILFNKFPNLEYFSNQVTLPSVSGQAIIVPNQLTDYKVPGEKLEFPTLTVSFQVDEDLRNYEEVLNWMYGIYFPEQHQQYADHVKDEDVDCKIVVQMLSNKSNSILNFEFFDAFPTSLSELDLGEGDSDYIICTASFEYSYFKINRNVR